MDRLDIDDPLVSRPEVPALAGLRLAKPAPRPRIGGYRLGMIGGILRLQVESGFCANAHAEARTATDIAAFVRAFDPICDLLIGAFSDDELIGTIAVDGRLQGSGIAAIRWFAVDRGQPDRLATSRILLEHATDFCRERGFTAVRLAQPAFDPQHELLFKEFGFRRHEDAAASVGSGAYPGMPVATLTL
jgi:GNAT superfamily N-acetyltransferase